MYIKENWMILDFFFFYYFYCICIYVQMVLDLWWLDLRFFDFMMV